MLKEVLRNGQTVQVIKADKKFLNEKGKIVKALGDYSAEVKLTDGTITMFPLASLEVIDMPFIEESQPIEREEDNRGLPVSDDIDDAVENEASFIKDIKQKRDALKQTNKIINYEAFAKDYVMNVVLLLADQEESQVIDEDYIKAFQDKIANYQEGTDKYFKGFAILDQLGLYMDNNGG